MLPRGEQRLMGDAAAAALHGTQADPADPLIGQPDGAALARVQAHIASPFGAADAAGAALHAARGVAPSLVTVKPEPGQATAGLGGERPLPLDPVPLGPAAGTGAAALPPGPASRMAPECAAPDGCGGGAGASCAQGSRRSSSDPEDAAPPVAPASLPTPPASALGASPCLPLPDTTALAGPHCAAASTAALGEEGLTLGEAGATLAAEAASRAAAQALARVLSGSGSGAAEVAAPSLPPGAALDGPLAEGLAPAAAAAVLQRPDLAGRLAAALGWNAEHAATVQEAAMLVG